MSYDNRGQVSIWSNKEGVEKNPKAPKWRGTVIAHRDIKEGEEIDMAIWANDSTHPKAPVMKGKISDKQNGEQNNAPPEDFDSDIPF